MPSLVVDVNRAVAIGMRRDARTLHQRERELASHRVAHTVTDDSPVEPS